MTQSPQPSSRKSTGLGAVAQSLVSLVVFLGLMAVSLFWPAGTLDWPRAWIFCAAYVAMILAAMVWVAIANPELFTVRRKFQKGTKGWDAVVASLTILCYVLILPAAALDAVRFGWTWLPDAVVIAGYVVLALGFAGVTWAQSVNRHFEATVRIQSDRDHKVIDTGPYSIIRHPGYSFAVMMAAGMALALGSLWALAPVAALALLLAGRTLGEEAVLHKGLPGYTEYAQRVKWRWLPLIW